MADTGAPWNIPFVEPTDTPRSYPQDSEDLALAIAAGLSAAGNPGIGSNVVQATRTSVFTTTSTSFVALPDLSATITPTTPTSKVLILASVRIDNTDGGVETTYRLMRDATAIFIGDTDGSRSRSTFVRVGINVMSSGTSVFLDNPNTNDPVTYSVEIRAAGGTALVNRRSNDTDASTTSRVGSSLIVIEVAP